MMARQSVTRHIIWKKSRFCVTGSSYWIGKIIAQGTSDELKALAKIEEKVTIETKHFKAEFLEKLQAAPNVDKAEYAGHQLVITYKSGKITWRS